MNKIVLQKFAKKVSIALLTVCFVTACATSSNPDEVKKNYVGWDVERLYQTGRTALLTSDYSRSAELLEATIAHFPFSTQASQARIALPYVYWKDEEQLKAIAAAHNYIETYPSSPYIDYMYYLEGIINYNQNLGLLASITGDGLKGRDSEAAKDSFLAFKKLVTIYPNSRYARDAQIKMKELVNTMAKNELIVARYYYERGAYLASINRAQSVLKDFDGNIAAPDALIMIIKSYEKLGQLEQRDANIKVFKHNFPNTSMELAKNNDSLIRAIRNRFGGSDTPKAVLPAPAP